MAGDAAIAVLGPIIEKAITPVVDTIVRHLGYLFCYKSNIKNLGERVAQLEKSINDADRFCEGRKRNNEETAQSIAGWLGNAKKMIEDAKKVEEATTKLKACLNLKGRYVQSRKSANLAKDIQIQQNKAPEGITTNTILPAGKLPGALANYASEGYKTRMQTMEEVMKALEDHAISVIGICGLGGVGKTTLVHEVRERVRQQNLFDEVAISIVSQNQDLFKIQGDVAEMLGLTSLKEETNVIGRADHLRKRLTGGNKVLIILDDVWSDIKLTDVGIPVGSGETQCKVVITSREARVCTDIQKNIEVRVLSKEEARALFRKTAGEKVVKNNNLEKIADEVADECDGLPITLLTLSKALSDKDLRAWEDALTRLREGNASGIVGMEKTYQRIKMSYDFLAVGKHHEAKSLLLLCCQHPEDDEINLELLAYHCLSLELFKGVSDVARARNRVYSLIEHLKSCFLLQVVGVDDEGKESEDGRVKVHDVIRDACLSMVSRDDRDKVYMHIMKKETSDSYKIGTSEVDYSKIKILVLDCFAPHRLTLSFQQMEELRVLEFFLVSGSSLVAFSFQLLTNLRMLSFQHGSIHPDTMSQLSMLTKLEILSFLGSTIESFPCEIGQLRNLKLLDLRCIHEDGAVTLIPSGILPGLTKLEVLYMGSYHFAEKTYSSNGAVDEGVREACVSELDSLPNLTTLQFNLLDPMRLLELKHFRFEKLERFYFGLSRSDESADESLYPLVLKTLHLEKIGIKWALEEKIQSIVERTVDLLLKEMKDWTDPLIIERFGSLRELEMKRCNQLEYIFHDGDGVFKNLEILRIGEMSNVRKLCYNGHLPEGSFYKLTKVELTKCMALECVFPHSAAKCLVHLQEITVKDCLKLKGIVSKGGEGPATRREAEIEEEPNNLLIHFPKLRHVTIQESHDLRGFYNLDDGRGQPLFNPWVMLPSIEILSVYRLHQLKQIRGGKNLDIPTLAAANSLQNLQILHVHDCESLESVFDFERQHGEEDTHVVTLSMLSFINLSRLPNLRHIFHYPLQYILVPKLRYIDVRDCGNLVNVFASNLIKGLHNLIGVDLANCESMKAVFDFEGLEAMTTMREDARSLLCEVKYIELSGLPKLEHICRQVPKEVNVFQNLKKLQVVDCDGLGYLIPSSIAHMLVNLQDLIVKRCKGMKEVIISKMNGEECGELEKKIVFRSLSGVRLEYLENLSSFCSRDQQVFEFPSLESLSIIQCPQIETFCCQILRETIAGGGGEIKKVTNDLVALFPKLKQVILGGTLHPLCYPLVMLPSIVKLEFHEMLQLKQIVGGEMLDTLRLAASDCLINLQTLFVHRCDSLETVFDFEGKKIVEENAHVVTLGKLHTIMLSRLSNLTHIFRGRMHDFSTPGLRTILIQRCDSLMRFAASSLLTLLQNLKQVRLKNCKAIRVVFDFEGFEVTREDAQPVLSKLEKIFLEKLPNLEHICRRVPKEINGFENLRSLEVDGCDSLSYLLTSTMAHMLVNLKTLVVEHCKSMKEVIKMTEDCGENKIVFHSLRHIELCSLEKLSSFCSTQLLEFGFPSLDRVLITKCPAMKTFCCGHLTAEKLQGVHFDENDDDNENEDDCEDDVDDDYYYYVDDDNDDDDDDDGDGDGDDTGVGNDKVVWKSDVNETIRYLNARVNHMKSDLKEDCVDVNDHVDEDDEIKEESDDDDLGINHGEDADDIHVPGEGVDNEYDQRANKASDHSGTSSSTPLDQATSKPRKDLLAPAVGSSRAAPTIVSPSPPASDNDEELAHASTPDLENFALPGLGESTPSASSEHSVPTSDSPLKTKANKKIDTSLSTSYDDWKRSRILIHGVYIKPEMKTAFEEILTANPNFLSGLRFKKAEIKTMFVESAISSLQCLRQYTARTMPQEQLAFIKESLDDLAASGLDMTWLKRGYRRASLVMKEEKAVVAATELARLERKKVEAEAAFEMARAGLEEVTAQRDASKAECDALLQEVEAGKELFGGDFDREASLGDGIL